MTVSDWLSKYGESHQNATNKLIHFIFVPLIMLSLLGLLWAIPMPELIAEKAPYLNVATLFIAFVLVFYARLSIPLMIGMLFITAAMLAVILYFTKGLGLSSGELALVMVGIFVVSWVFQFIGHKIEGQKPSFIDDLKFLLIGPLWIMSFLFRKLGIKY